MTGEPIFWIYKKSCDDYVTVKNDTRYLRYLTVESLILDIPTYCQGYHQHQSKHHQRKKIIRSKETQDRFRLIANINLYRRRQFIMIIFRNLNPIIK